MSQALAIASATRALAGRDAAEGIGFFLSSDERFATGFYREGEQLLPIGDRGDMVAAGQENLLYAWWIAFFPGCLLAITLVAFSLLADGLRDALDPKALMQKFV